VEKLIQQHRRQLGDFDAVDIADEAEVARLRERVDVEVPVELHWTWNYGSEVAELRSLYEKGKGGQWNAQTDVDWSTPCAPDEWVMNPEGSLLAQVTGFMGADEATRKAAAFDELGYLLSQLLHGEQAALQLCGQLTNVCEKMDEKWYAASQVIDEARHVEVFSKLLETKLGGIHPIAPTLKVLLDMLLEADTVQKKTLGMQTLFEGMAVGIMDLLRSESRNELVIDILRRVEQDEARHAAFGVLMMRRIVRERRAGGLGLRHPGGTQRQPAARHAPPPRPEVRHRSRRRDPGLRRHARVRGAEQPALHAHRHTEPAQPRPHHRAHAGALEGGGNDGGQRRGREGRPRRGVAEESHADPLATRPRSRRQEARELALPPDSRGA
jgi:hypothetical protein